jgi:hypothetical protein
MRFVLCGEWKPSPLQRVVLVFFLVFVVLFWVSSALLYFRSMSLDPQSVLDHLLGRAGEWGQPAVPRSYKVLLEMTHAHLFSMGVLLFILTHLLLFVPAPERWKVPLAVVSFTSALLEQASSWLVVYVHELFSYLKVATFVLMQVSLLLLVALLFGAVFRGGRKPSQALAPADAQK